MPYRNRILPLLALASLMLPLGACADGDGLDAACFEVQQPQILNNAGSLQGTSLNGIRLNALTTNGIRLNAGYTNGIRLNASYINGIRLNANYINGIRLNAQYVNGTFLPNGTSLDAKAKGGIALHGSVHGDVRIDGARLVVTVDGVRVPDQALIGAVLTAGEGDAAFSIEITDVTVDDNDARLAFYQLAVEGQPVCEAGFDKGVFVAGSFNERGDWLPDASGSTASYSCENGVMEKCLLWGYAPWTTGDDAYQTCTRMARADYCGDGVPWTQNGTLIDVFDTLGVQQTANDPALSFEAGWGPGGAVCVSEPRYDVRDDIGDQVRAPCWDALARCSSFDEAIERGAMLGNESAHTEIAACTR